jgi:hypothetical protein
MLRATRCDGETELWRGGVFPNGPRHAKRWGSGGAGKHTLGRKWPLKVPTYRSSETIDGFELPGANTSSVSGRFE